MSAIHLVDPDGDGTPSLECFKDDPDAESGEHIMFADLGTSWDEMAAQVAVHMAAHNCGTVTLTGMSTGTNSETLSTRMAAEDEDDEAERADVLRMRREMAREAGDDSPGADPDDGYPDSEREADALAYQRNGDDERDDQ